MTENKIELKSINEFLGMKFFIPSYQRGYRWTDQQVKDLLNDIWEFSQKKKKEFEFYSLQPLVIKRKDDDVLGRIKNANSIEEVETLLKGSWEVIDGQQRLTTILIILSELKKEGYSIEYETRKDSILNNIDANKKDDNVDYYHIIQSKQTVSSWFDNDEEKKSKFTDVLLNSVKFIWYESVDENPIKVFTRLNIGKISLTNAELIKALFLNRSNFGENNLEHLKMRQQEIASEWDDIEYTLQNDEFWLFLHDNGYDRPTRIDFIFDLICEQEVFGKNENIGTDDYKTFRYFYEYFHNPDSNLEDKVKNSWSKVKMYFQTFQEWYNDLVMYHYVGYLIHQGEKLDNIFNLWSNSKNTKDDFISELIGKIKDKIKNCNDLSKQYEIDGAPSKTTCKPLLLLHNIQTVINQNNQLKSKEEYKQPVFYKFPFHLFKKEKWDVEHIDSNTINGLEKEKDQKEWLKYSVLGANLSEELKDKIKAFLRNDNERMSFEDLYQEIENIIHSQSWLNPELDKNKVWNFVLLDAGTNRGYGKSIFPAKRRCIIGKDQGKKYSIDNDTLDVTLQNGAIAFIPPVTKNVFLKYYNTTIDNLREWNESDAKAYKQNILDTLKDFGVVDLTNYKTEEK